MSKNTVKKWVKRYKEHGTKGIKEKSHAPHHIPHKVLSLPALDLDELFQIKFNLPPPHRGHDVHGLS